QAIAFELQKLFYLNGACYFSHDIGCYTTDITFHNTVCTDDYFGRADDISNQRTVYSKIAATGNITLERSSAADKTCTAWSRWSFSCFRFGFVIKHWYQILIVNFFLLG